MSDIWLLGAFPGFVLGLWASFTPMRENEWSILGLFGVGAAGGALVGFLAVTGLVIGLGNVYAAGWVVALLIGFFFANVGCVFGRVVALLLALVNRKWHTQRALFAVSLGLVAGLVTGAAFAAVTVGSGALSQFFSSP